MRQEGRITGMTADAGLEKLNAAAGIYIRALGKKKEGEDREKSLPPEIFGAAMVAHGGEYASDSAYGQALLRLGSGMERIGRIQEVVSNLTWLMNRHTCTKRLKWHSIRWKED
jgi:hypothetical protein